MVRRVHLSIDRARGSIPLDGQDKFAHDWRWRSAPLRTPDSSHANADRSGVEMVQHLSRDNYRLRSVSHPRIEQRPLVAEDQLRGDGLQMAVLNQVHSNVDFVARITDEFGSNGRVGPQHRAVCLQFQTMYLVIGAPRGNGADDEVDRDQQLTRSLQEEEWPWKTGCDALEHANVLLHWLGKLKDVCTQIEEISCRITSASGMIDA